MTEPHLRYAVSDRVATITLNRPDKLNAYTPEMRDALVGAFEALDRDDAVRVAIVTGAGRAFCAGADLSTSAGATFSHPDIRLADYRDGGGRVALAIFRCRKPVIAAINGPAVGVGITMTLPMDIRVVAEDAKIGFVFARRGIVPEACSSWFLPRIVGPSKAAELIYTGRVFRAAEEAHSGLFSYVLPAEQVLAKAEALAREIAENTSATSVALSKALLTRGMADPNPETAHLNDSRCIYWAGMQNDAREGIASFLEKRPAAFTMSAATDMPDFYPWWIEPKL
ncbi:MAG TPA: enoyl-CoA hydratase-related protein [Polyangiaceae bacterium]|jgi:enoyl-CoA hydratase/carnithine racemase|nr:enoyl-CoA hydratase-related protein [Polyangiaceae bacterium]